jgi:hypothetical protein
MEPSDTCMRCGGVVRWQHCPTGGWWIHDQHPSDDHDAYPGWRPAQEMDDQGWWHTVDPVKVMPMSELT